MCEEISTWFLKLLNVLKIHDSEQQEGLLHTLLKRITTEQLYSIDNHQKIVYYLVNHGQDVNAQDEDGNTVLHLCVLHHEEDIELCEAVIQCGADLYAFNKTGMSPTDLIECSEATGRLGHLFNRYKPGLWLAIERDDLMDVRRLVNMWCRVDLQNHGKSLKLLALDKGTENIIRLVIDMEQSLKLAHAVMGDDINTLTEILKKKKSVNINIKNMGDMGATPLYYAIMQNNTAIVKLLYQHGARMEVTIAIQDEEVPIYYTTLHKDTDPEIIKLLTPKRPDSDMLLQLHYKGQNVLIYSIENGVAVNALSYILQQGYPELVSRKDPQGMCARDLALALNKPKYATMIDEIVYEWSLSGDGSNRKILALMGYPYIKEGKIQALSVNEVLQTMETSSLPARFDYELTRYQDQICQLVNAVEESNLKRVNKLMFYESDSDCFQSCLGNALAKDDNQPLLHKAVLRQDLEMVEYITSVIQLHVQVQFDTIRDGYFRTALHYAHALITGTGKQIVELLLDKGCSDFAMDINSRTPQAFRDHKKSPIMRELVVFHLNKYRSYGSDETIYELNPFKPAAKRVLKHKCDAFKPSVVNDAVNTLGKRKDAVSTSYFGCCIL